MIQKVVLTLFLCLYGFFSVAQEPTGEAVVLSEQMQIFLQNSHSMKASEKNFALDQITSQLFSRGSGEYRTTLQVLKDFWNTDPGLSQAALLKFQREWEFKMSPNFWRQRRLSESSKRYVPLIFVVNVLSPPKDSTEQSFNDLRWSRDVYMETTSLDFPAPVSLLADLPEVQRLEPVSIEEFLSEQQFQNAQVVLEGLGASAAGLAILRNTRGMRVASRGNPLKFTPVGLLVTALAIGATEGLISWVDRQSLDQVENTVRGSHINVEDLDLRSSDAEVELQYKAFETAVRNYALRLILPVFQKINDNNENLGDYSARQVEQQQYLDQLLTLKIQWLEQKLSGVENPEVPSENTHFRTWTRYTEDLMRDFARLADSGDDSAEQRALQYLTEQLEGMKQQLSESDESLNEVVLQKESRLNSKLRTTTFNTLFQRRSRQCSYEFFRNQWLEQIVRDEEPADYLPTVLKHYALYYRPQGSPDPVEQWMQQILNPVMDPATMVDYVHMELTARFHSDFKTEARGTARESINRTMEEWNQSFEANTYCGNPVAFLDQVLAWLELKKQDSRESAAATKISNNIKTLRHGLYVQLEALITPSH